MTRAEQRKFYRWTSDKARNDTNMTTMLERNQMRRARD
jgi:hypothetical protein